MPAEMMPQMMRDKTLYYDSTLRLMTRRRRHYDTYYKPGQASLLVDIVP